MVANNIILSSEYVVNNVKVPRDNTYPVANWKLDEAAKNKPVSLESTDGL